MGISFEEVPFFSAMHSKTIHWSIFDYEWINSKEFAIITFVKNSITICDEINSDGIIFLYKLYVIM